MGQRVYTKRRFLKPYISGINRVKLKRLLIYSLSIGVGRKPGFLFRIKKVI
ncbi:MAG: hypothetical protein M1533_00155 [Candidatus Thermoplasmatota archaeon]|nr:hypothetical protein [Candidatus Thermoplasmatota archaeon]MCL5794592.1 hypothetical protein [Candidatus Thermoplasmatota archaeon]